jgi:UDP-MurNAc hydroxylase
VKLTQIYNACAIYEFQGYKLLADPWLTDGAFEGSWYHYPPLTTTVEDIKNVDFLYISHLHPDHFDQTVLSRLEKTLPVIVLDHGPNFLHRKLEALGFTNLIKVKDKETRTVGPFEVTLYAPFVTHPFDQSDLGNFLDSAMVVEAGGKVILNANDNTPDIKAAQMLKERHGKVTVAQLKDALAGAYPSCFVNLSSAEKFKESKRLISRQLNAMCLVAKELEAEWFQPFAGDYQLGGKLADKNPFLGVPGRFYTAQFISGQSLKPLILNERGSIDLITGEIKASYHPGLIPYDKWIKRVKAIPYEWEADPVREDLEELKSLCILARQNLWRVQERFNFKPNYTMAIEADSKPVFNFNFNNVETPDLGKADLTCYVDSRVLYRILTRKGHWNNFEVGCHIDFNRPGPYNPDIHAIMSFFLVS